MVRTLGEVFATVQVWTHDGPATSRQQHFNVVAAQQAMVHGAPG